MLSASEKKCIDKKMYKTERKARDAQKYFLDKFGNPSELYRCHLNGLRPHYHLTTKKVFIN